MIESEEGRSLMRALLNLLSFLLVIWMIGFAVFVLSLDREDVTRLPIGFLDNPEVGIVALTGGGGRRITAAMGLLDKGYGERVLVTGVHPDIGAASIASLAPIDSRLFECCVDLGTRAQTTRGNAIETREWVAERGYATLILVTTDYHMPRAEAELNYLIRSVGSPVEIIRFPVSSKVAPANSWFKSPKAWRVLQLEYMKYLLVRLEQIVGL